MVKVVGVKFKTSGRIYFFDPLSFDIQAGDGVIVETARGVEFADVPSAPCEVPEEQVIQPLKPVLRIASEEDKRLRALYAAKEPEAYAVCQEKIQDHKLDMKLVDVEYTFNGSKVVFYFTADERVDFRELVKDLAYVFKTRIELRQIGVRDEAKMLGGLGPCGRAICCKSFLDDFRPVSIKMAKEQNLSLSPTKISGLCGRLMCCLQYEEACYEQMRKLMPRTGREIETPDGVGLAIDNNIVTEKTRVKLTAADGTIDIREYPYTDLGPGAAERAKERLKVQQEENAAAQSDREAPAESEETAAVQAYAARNRRDQGQRRESRPPRSDAKQENSLAPSTEESAAQEPPSSNRSRPQRTPRPPKAPQQPRKNNGELNPDKGQKPNPPKEQQPRAPQNQPKAPQNQSKAPQNQAKAPQSQPNSETGTADPAAKRRKPYYRRRPSNKNPGTPAEK